MNDIRQIRLARWERIKKSRIWRFVLLRGVLGWGLSMGIVSIFLSMCLEKMRHFHGLLFLEVF